MRERLARTPADSPKRADYLSELGAALAERFEQAGDPGYLAEAIEAGRAAVAAAHPGDKRRGKYLNNLALTLRAQFLMSGDVAILDEALVIGEEAVAAAGRRKRGMYLANLGNIHKTRFNATGHDADITRAIGVYRAAIEVTRRGPRLAIPLGNLSNVMRTRGELTRDRASLDEAVELAHAAVRVRLARDPRRFESLCAAGDAHLARFELAGEPDDIAAAVTYLRAGAQLAPAGYEGHSAAWSGLAAALASQVKMSGNLTEMNDAIDAARMGGAPAHPRHPQKPRDLCKLRGALRARYDQVGETGALALLPLHGAGYHDGSGRAVVERVISSYAPTLRSLLEAQRPDQPDGTPAGQPDLLVVTVPGMPAITGMAELRDVDREAQLLAGLFKDHCQVLTDDMATTRAVLDAMTTHPWVHFGCHGFQNLNDPSQAGLLLSDGTLRITEISARSFRGDLALLLSCQSATGGVNLPDEVITLAASLHYTGYRHVIGTLWRVYDDTSADVADAFYHEMSKRSFDADASAVALHHAVATLRRQRPDLPLMNWLPYTHIGP